MLKIQVSKFKDLLRNKQLAYWQVLGQRSNAHKAVLVDLAKFCRAFESTFNKDERATLVLEGRREVWLRIQSFLKLSEDELYELHHLKNEE